MNHATKLAIIGLVLGCTVAAVGRGYLVHLESGLESSRLDCVASGERAAAVPGSYSSLAEKFGGKLLCDPIALRQAGVQRTYPPGAQMRLLQAHEEIEAWRLWPNLVAGFFVLLFGVPWLWYFIIYRIGELRHAIFGK